MNAAQLHQQLTDIHRQLEHTEQSLRRSGPAAAAACARQAARDLREVAQLLARDARDEARR